MERREKLYEGKAKILYATDDPDLVIQYFKDEATAFNALKKGVIENKGIYNNAISSTLFAWLEEQGVRTHFVRKLSDREMLVRRLRIIPIEVVARNIVAGSLAKRLGLAEGTPLPRPIVELYYKRDDLGDPMINEDHVAVLDLATAAEVRSMREQALEVNRRLSKYLEERGLRLIDFKLEFGRHKGGLLLGDEITPDGCRFWDIATAEKLDKDRFRRDLGGVEAAYQEVYRRICGGG
ncbi:MAG: phosphoribosylaminoimidazolesuccinocarboxamide synthase [Deltaproteobacteria bacterium]|nr:phosphoribosylaminoimidazolesuccinocarboxamide synthase [Deltaproteobacteria bacterium]MBI3076838.1 phosphoribosylaminoimidazolesuccinocarboxamide synthase [Deltaproteobacteria bacterium]